MPNIVTVTTATSHPTTKTRSDYAECDNTAVKPAKKLPDCHSVRTHRRKMHAMRRTGSTTRPEDPIHPGYMMELRTVALTQDLDDDHAKIHHQKQPICC